MTTADHAPYDKPVWGSDVMVDALRQLDLPYVSLNPGSSFRGLHDSLVNYAGDEIQMIECPHEKIAVALAHGYAKVTGKPMVVILHDLVGLLHGTMGIYYAYIDRVPCSSSAAPARPTTTAGVPTSTGSIRRTCRARWYATTPSGITSHARWRAFPTSSRGPTASRRPDRTVPPTSPLTLGCRKTDWTSPCRSATSRPSRRHPRRRAGPDGVARARGETLLRPATRHGAGLPRSRPRLVHPPRRAGRAGRHWRCRYALAAELPDPSPSHRHRHQCDRRRGLRAVRRRQGHGQVDPPHRSPRPTGRLPAAPDCRVLSLGFADIGISSWSEDYAQLIPADQPSWPTPPSPCLSCSRNAGGSRLGRRGAHRAERRVDPTRSPAPRRTWAGWAQLAPTSRARPRSRPPSWPQPSGRSCRSTTGC